MPDPPTSTLYRRFLGPRFADLHPVLRHFHSQAAGTVAKGRFDIHCPDRWLPRTLRAVLRLPRPARDVPVVLEVTVQGDRERWLRKFDRTPLVTTHAIRGDLLVESSWPVGIGMSIDTVDGGMRFRTRRLWICGLPWPKWLGPRAEADVVPHHRGWHADVRMYLPLVGLLLRYQGEIDFAPPAAAAPPSADP